MAKTKAPKSLRLRLQLEGLLELINQYFYSHEIGAVGGFELVTKVSWKFPDRNGKRVICEIVVSFTHPEEQKRYELGGRFYVIASSLWEHLRYKGVTGLLDWMKATRLFRRMFEWELGVRPSGGTPGNESMIVTLIGNVVATDFSEDTQKLLRELIAWKEDDALRNKWVIDHQKDTQTDEGRRAYTAAHEAAFPEPQKPEPKETLDELLKQMMLELGCNPDVHTMSKTHSMNSALDLF